MDTAAKARTKPTARSRVTNGSSLGAMDGRSKWARRLRDLISLYSHDMGGDNVISQMQRSMVRRAATLTVELERAEDSFALTGKPDADELSAYQTTVNSLRRVLESLGLQKHTPKPVIPTPDLDEKGVDQSGWRGLVERVVTGDMDARSLGAVAGPDHADFELRRRLAFAINQALHTDGKLPPRIAEIAVELGLASFAPEEKGATDADVL